MEEECARVEQRKESGKGKYLNRKKWILSENCVLKICMKKSSFAANVCSSCKIEMTNVSAQRLSLSFTSEANALKKQLLNLSILKILSNISSYMPLRMSKIAGNVFASRPKICEF